MATLTLEKMAARRDLRPDRRRFPSLLDRRALAGAALREDALRQRACSPSPTSRRSRRPGARDFARVARETLDYLRARDDRADGGFYSATDADSKGRTASEGKFFVWSRRRSTASSAAGPDAERFIAPLRRDRRRQLRGREHPARRRARRGASGRARGGARDALRGARRAGRRPARREDSRGLERPDDPGAGFGGRVLDEPRYIDGAARAAASSSTTMRPDGRLARSWKDGRAGPPASSTITRSLPPGCSICTRRPSTAAGCEGRWRSPARPSACSPIRPAAGS